MAARLGRVTTNRAGLAEVMSSPGVRQLVWAKGQQVVTAAKNSAPVESGTYRESIRAVEDFTPWGWARVRVLATASHAALVEFRTGNLARAMESAGL